MTAPTLDAPAPPAGVRFVAEGPSAGALWRRALLRAALVPVPVLAPLVALAPSRDHRFNIYWHGGLFRDDPLRIVPHTVDSLPGYLRLGNFRLFGRMLEKGLDLAAYALGDLGVPANVAFRLVSFASMVLLTVVAVLLVESVVARGRMFRRPPSTLAAMVPFAVAGGFVAAGGASPAVLFGGLYYASAAVVLGVVAVLCRIGRLRGWWVPVLLVAGAALAAFNEIAYLALPLATVAVAARGRLVLGVPWRRLVTGPLALLWGGFLPVFGAVRVVIRGYCADGPCYRGSDIAFGPAVAEALPVRAIAWLPPLMWRGAVAGGSDRPWAAGGVLAAAVLVLGVLAWLALRDLPRLSDAGRPAALAVAVTGGTLVVLGAALAALNADVQQIVAAGNWGHGWRDSAVTTTAGALALVGATHLVRGRRWLPAVLIVLLAGGAAVSAAANKRYRDTTMSRPAAQLANRLAQEMADFDRTPAGAARRCALRAEFAVAYGTTPYSLSRFDKSFDTAARQHAGMPFCPGVTQRIRGR
jgi:hypothetical protein